jgi:hypothetical protein
MVVLPSTGASRYHNCCIDGGTIPEYFGYSLVCADFTNCAADQADNFAAQDACQTSSMTQDVYKTSDLITQFIVCTDLILGFPNALLILICATELCKQYLWHSTYHIQGKALYYRICSAVHLTVKTLGE